MTQPGDFAAFPIQASDSQGSLYAEQGLTKREYFALKIMAAIIVARPKEGLTVVVENAVIGANALIAALNSIGIGETVMQTEGK